MRVKIKLGEGATLPSYAREGDAAMDLTATSISWTDTPKYGYVEYGTNIFVEVPPGYVCLLFSRSSVSNTGLIQSNAVGVLDSGFRGEIRYRFKWIKDSKHYEVGERIGQMLIIPYPKIEWDVVEELSQTERNSGGFGSTDIPSFN